MGIIAVIIFVLLACYDVMAITSYNVTACHNLRNDCGMLKLDECADNEIMYLSEMTYGLKNQSFIASCSQTEESCFRDDVGCCHHSASDCLSNYTAYHAYEIKRQCSGNSKCQLRAAGNLVSCSATSRRLSTYSTIWYSCIKDVINFCEGIYNITKSAHIIFDKKTQSPLCGRSNCSCVLSSTENLEITYIDIRMAKRHTDIEFSDCSSAVLVSEPNVYQNKQCNTSLEEDAHFEYMFKNKTSVSTLSIELRDLYANDPGDSPEFVWILVEADKNADITVRCVSPTPTTCQNGTTGSTTISDSRTTSTSTSERTSKSTPMSSTTIDTTSTTEIITAKSDASSGVAVISGVTASVGLLLIITVLAVCFNIIKRRRNRQSETQPKISINSAAEEHDFDRLAEHDYDNAPDVRVIRLGDGYIDFAVRGHPGSQNTAIAWPLNNVKQRPILPKRPQLSEQNSRHNLPEPRPCRNVHHLRATKNDYDGHQLQQRGSQSQVRNQEVFDYI
ncbi:hypothetical protein DPMN_046325 [Dreissena polymorpha]|uniref:SUEL-type lectin domain-containing protein n=1 Tax=Dreissena polymorpha TaxID=45954 RepID=A0A9D4D884_DREPO|nr:hypothetical protein DPMN_046325 [Dreissena polymorpha]